MCVWTKLRGANESQREKKEVKEERERALWGSIKNRKSAFLFNVKYISHQVSLCEILSVPFNTLKNRWVMGCFFWQSPSLSHRQAVLFHRRSTFSLRRLSLAAPAQTAAKSGRLLLQITWSAVRHQRGCSQLGHTFYSTWLWMERWENMLRTAFKNGCAFIFYGRISGLTVRLESRGTDAKSGFYSAVLNLNRALERYALEVKPVVSDKVRFHST